MTNTLSPFGFAVSRSKTGQYSGNVTACYVPATNSAKLYIGDAVYISGSNAAAIEEYKVGNLPIIVKAGASTAIDGVIVGFLPNGAFSGTTYMPASTAGVALVVTNKEVTFNIQATGAVNAADIGKYAKISTSTAGDDYSGISGMALDHSTLSTDASLPLKVLNVADYITNDAGSYAIVEVELNTPAASAASGS
mgnify:CR=1 FL=1